jgi:glycosyltransferase involved in cell wall biosynthesis
MLSICIPNFNTDIRKLVGDLHRDAKLCPPPFEIIVLEDASTSFLSENQSIESLTQVRYCRNETNLGRSRNRNRLMELAQYEYLLFIDGDACLDQSGFIQAYLDVIQKGWKVICGGTAYREEPPDDPALLLRYLYGRQREMLPASKRNQQANRAFATFNFVIQKAVLKEIPFE